MGHTQSRYQQDAGFPDGSVRYGPLSAMVTGAAAALTRNAVGDYSLNMGAAVTTTFAINLLEGEIIRTGFSEDLQESFGGAQPSGSAQPQFYRPDLIGSMNTAQQLQPRTGNKTKGMRLTALAVDYFITGAALTGHTIRLDSLTFVNGAIGAAANILAVAANGLQTAVSANRYVTSIVLPAAGQVYYTTDNTDLIAELAVTTQAAGAYRFYGFRALWEFNFS